MKASRSALRFLVFMIYSFLVFASLIWSSYRASEFCVVTCIMIFALGGAFSIQANSQIDKIGKRYRCVDCRKVWKKKQLAYRVPLKSLDIPICPDCMGHIFEIFHI